MDRYGISPIELHKNKQFVRSFYKKTVPLQDEVTKRV